MVDKDDLVVAGKSVLELGAGAGLPSLICALVGVFVRGETTRFSLACLRHRPKGRFR